MDAFILEKVISYLPQDQNVQSCSMVNKTWRELCYQILTWHTVFTRTFQHDPITFCTKKLATTNIQSVAHTTLGYELHTDDPTIPIQGWKIYYNPHGVVPFCELFAATNQEQNKGLWRSKGCFRDLDFLFTLEITCQINIREYKKLVSEATAVPGLDFLWTMVENENRNKQIDNMQLKQMQRKIGPIVQPEGFSNIVLNSVQLRSIGWMLDTEKSNRCVELPDTNLVLWQTQLGTFYYDKQKKEPVHPDQLPNYHETMQVKGGILADEVGVGKKVEIAGLILAAPKGSNIEEKEKDIKVKATLILCSNVNAWKQVFQQNTNLKVLAELSLESIEQCKNSDIAKSDVVIVDPGFGFANNRNTRLRYCTLDEFFWHRIVFVDMQLRIRNEYHLREFCKSLSSRMLWFVSDFIFNTEPVFPPTYQTYWPIVMQLEEPVKFLGLQNTNHSKNILANRFIWAANFSSVENECPTISTSYVAVPITTTEIAHELGKRESQTQAKLDSSCWNKPLDQLRADLLTIFLIDVQSLAQYNKFDNLKKFLLIYVLLLHAETVYQGEPIKLSDLLLHVSDRVLANKANANTAQLANETRHLIHDSYTLAFLTNSYGSKIAHVLLHLAKLWEQEPNSRVLILCWDIDVIRKLRTVLNACNISLCGIDKNKEYTGDKVKQNFRYRLYLATQPLQPEVLKTLNHIFVIVQSGHKWVPERDETHINKILATISQNKTNQKVGVKRFFWRDTSEHEYLWQKKYVDYPRDRESWKKLLDPLGDVGMGIQTRSLEEKYLAVQYLEHCCDV